ncbi:hypothetical protein [Fusobacterium varium]|uniref:hypothetical protein n=1 Tax=Fusobacterium varium TaxID=856 RepID=UPI0029267845|nr:hypothetical protein AUSP0054_00077 [uncultured phage]
MNEFIGVEEVTKLCKVCSGKAYEIIRELNQELSEKGFLTLKGKINKKYLLERFGLE